MLTELPLPITIKTSPILDLISGGTPKVWVLGKGLYQITNFSFDYMLGDLVLSSWPFESAYANGDTAEARLAALRECWDKGFPTESYGVCDEPQQVLDAYPMLESDQEHQYIVSFTLIRREDQPSSGGWRWHKWGKYLGTQKPRFEYLYNETDIDQVYTFHILEVDSTKL